MTIPLSDNLEEETISPENSMKIGNTETLEEVETHVPHKLDIIQSEKGRTAVSLRNNRHIQKSNEKCFAVERKQIENERQANGSSREISIESDESKHNFKSDSTRVEKGSGWNVKRRNLSIKYGDIFLTRVIVYYMNLIYSSILKIKRYKTIIVLIACLLFIGVQGAHTQTRTNRSFRRDKVQSASQNPHTVRHGYGFGSLKRNLKGHLKIRVDKESVGCDVRIIFSGIIHNATRFEGGPSPSVIFAHYGTVQPPYRNIVKIEKSKHHYIVFLLNITDRYLKSSYTLHNKFSKESTGNLSKSRGVEEKVVPERPSNVRVYKTTGTSISISWVDNNSKSNSRKVFLEYSLKGTRKRKKVSLSSRSNRCTEFWKYNYTVPHLKPRSTYVLRLYFENRIGKGNITSTEAKTKGIKRRKPKSLPKIAIVMIVIACVAVIGVGIVVYKKCKMC